MSSSVDNDTDVSPHAKAQTTTPYVVLARKYRPRNFTDLIGQDVMVRTLTNAFDLDRIAQAYMLTGVRGVGKTTTARILARALNYEREGDAGRPTLDMQTLGVHCQAIMDSRHVDVLEMDAASHTGIDDIREIIEAVKYKPASARYRVFIIDEVHMLSKSAFNGLLKTLEEPPPHAKFIFATTEIHKVPITVLSRCQRFDLRRVDQDTLSQHFAKVVGAEGQNADHEALLILSRAADGSVRDGLSLLDQALTLGGGTITSDLVRGMIGIAGRDAIFDLLDRIFHGDAAQALSLLQQLHDKGGDPAVILTDLADGVHALTRLCIVPDVYPTDFVESEREAAKRLSTSIPISRLSTAWQMLLKGIDEVSRANRPFAAAEMLLIRMCYTARLPAPSEIIRELKKNDSGQTPPITHNTINRERSVVMSSASGETQNAVAVETSPQTIIQAAPRFSSFEDVAAYASEIRDIKLKIILEEQVEIVQFGQGFIELHLLPSAPRNIGQELSKKLQTWSGERWVVSLSEKRGTTPLGEQRRQAESQALEEIKRHPTVKSVLHHFPDAQIKGVRLTDNKTRNT